MLLALARADGLYAAPVPIGSAGARIFRAWRRFGAWDESRQEPDVLRVKPTRWGIPTPTSMLASACLDLLLDVPGKAFASLPDVVAATLSDLRTGSATSRLSRARRLDRELFAASPDAVLATLLERSLPHLGVLDRGESEVGPVLRLSERARAWLSESKIDEGGAPSGRGAFDASGVLRLPATVSVVNAVALGDFADAAASGDSIALTFNADSIEHGISNGVSVDTMRSRLLRVVDVIDARVEALFAKATAARVACELVHASAFVRIPDAELRRRFLLDEAGASLVHDNSPEGGLLVRAGISIARVERVLRRLGADLVPDAKA